MGTQTKEGRIARLLRILKGLPDDDADLLLEELDHDGESTRKAAVSDITMVDITKVDEDQQVFFGWANLTISKDGAYVLDTQGDEIDVASLEENAYLFNLLSREGDEQHTDAVKMHLVESMVITPEKIEALAKRRIDGKLATDPEALEHLRKAMPQAGWWTGWYVPDADIFAKVKSGQYSQLSIGGRGVREPIGA